MRHTSGFAYANNTLNDQVKAAYTSLGVGWQDQTPTEQIQRLAQAPLAHQPGTTWDYSLSTDVLGRVVEKASGMTLGAFLSERVFAPLKMRDTAFLVPKEKVARLAQPFAVDKATGKPITLLDVTVAQKNDAGGAGSAGTAADYARFAQMLANGGTLDGARLLGRATVGSMTSDQLGAIKAAIPTLQVGYGFGLGFAVRKETGVNPAPGSVGEYNWGGAAGTGFLVQKEGRVWRYCRRTRCRGGSRALAPRGVRQLVYQAIID